MNFDGIETVFHFKLSSLKAMDNQFKLNFPPIPHEMSALMQVLRLVVTFFYRAKSKELCSME
jgi:hypothetical protein